jgi:hypothetical protein
MISESQLRSIEMILQEFPLCLQIAAFLVQNDRAIDTVKGVADFWVRHDRIAVQSALDRLIMCGAVVSYNMISGTLYGLTRQGPLRKWLQVRVGELVRHPHAADGGAAPPVQALDAEASE